MSYLGIDRNLITWTTIKHLDRLYWATADAISFLRFKIALGAKTLHQSSRSVLPHIASAALLSGTGNTRATD